MGGRDGGRLKVIERVCNIKRGNCKGTQITGSAGSHLNMWWRWVICECELVVSDTLKFFFLFFFFLFLIG